MAQPGFRARTHPLLPLVLLPFLAFGAACPQVAPQRPAPGLTGTSWQLVRFEGGDGTMLTPDDKGKYTIAFGTNGRVSVRIDCNRGNGTWRSAGSNHLEFGPLALTRVICPPGSLHDRIVRHWPFVRSYVIRDGHLFLSLMADGGIYEYEPTSRPSEASLEKTYWKLTNLAGGLVTPQREPHFILHPANGSVTGSGGCNRLTGRYELKGDRISFSRVASTMMACIHGTNTEQLFLRALGRVNRWRIRGQQLELFDLAGTPVAHFEAFFPDTGTERDGTIPARMVNAP